MALFHQGDFLLITKDIIPSLGTKASFFVEGISFSCDTQAGVLQARKRDKRGRVTTAAAESGEVNHVVKINTQVQDWYALQLLDGQLATTETSQKILHRRYGQVPIASPYEFSDADLAGTTTDVSVQIMARGTWGETGPRAVVTGTPTAGQVKVAAGKFTFTSGDAGAPFGYTVPKTYATIEAIGKTSVAEYLGEMEGFFTASSDSYYPDGTQFYFPTLIRTMANNPKNFEQSPVQGMLTFAAIPPVWNNLPYVIYNMATATT